MLETTTRCDVIQALQVEMNSIKATIDSSLGESVPVHYDNTEYTSESDQPFVSFVINFSGNGEKLDAVTNRQAGIAVAQVFTPLAKGTKQSAQITDIIEDGFKGLKWVDDVLLINFTAVASIGKEGGMYQTNVNIYFEYKK